MSIIDKTNSAEHVYPTYGRRFRSYRWYKPIIAGVVFMIVLTILALILTGAVAIITGSGIVSGINEAGDSIFAEGYDDMELANGWQSIMTLGSVVIFLPALWLTALIVRDRPFSSYSSARGGWDHKVFWKVFPIAFACISLPVLVDELLIEHRLSDFDMKFTIASFLIVTILGPLQCIAEEYTFRGLLMQTFGSWFRLPIIAVILQAAIFVLVHPYNTYGKIEIFISGAVFGLAAWFGRGIEVSSAFHICNNMTIFYLQGMNMATISADTTLGSMMFSVVCDIVFAAAIFIISKKTNWFDEIQRDDVAEWNKKIDDKIARKEAKAAAKADKKAARMGLTGSHDERAPGKHFK